MMVGGFPRGHFATGTQQLVSEMFTVDTRSLDAWVVAGRFVYDFEWSMGLAKNRLESTDQAGSN
jgi:rRNA pseudouridine-1189 N-methylase Emg1 (Nep1/Mra1 family)